MRCKVKKVQRLDSIKLDSTYFTDEGYLIDHPIVTSCGIFEYTNPDGSIRRELRLPEHVFAENSLASYKGKPIIITHEAGVVDKDNVDEEQIGTILSKGYRDGEDVRTEIIIHDTDAMKRSGFKELSCGYKLDLVEEPGTWNDEPYDAIQTNITINHLALVANARAGEQARLNIDGSDKEPTLRGGKAMKSKTKKAAVSGNGRRNDGDILSPEQLQEAIANYCKEKGMTQDAPTEEADEEEVALDADETVSEVQENKDRRDEAGEPGDVESAKEVIAQQDSDIEKLLTVIKQLKEQNGITGDSDDTAENADEGEEEKADGEGCEENSDEGDSEKLENTDGDENKDKSLNADSADRIVRQRLAICRVGDKLGMNGLENMSIMAAKKAVIKKVLPSMRLDGKGASYVEAAYDMAVDNVNKRKGVSYQRAQMASGEKRHDGAETGTTSNAAAARKAMMERREGGNE